MRRTVLITTLLAFGVAACGSEPEGETCEGGRCDEADYVTAGECDGLPRLNVETPPGVCVGLVADGFKKPRGITELPNGEFIVADMGGWAENIGIVWKLARRADGSFEKERMLSQIDKPSGAVTGPDGLPYIGAADAIFRFDPAEGPGARLTLVVRDLPTDGRHPLTHMVFDGVDPWLLHVNVGSGTDVCEDETGENFPFPCPEAEGLQARGVIRSYPLEAPSRVGGDFRTTAFGLRNSMGLAAHPSGTLLQAENARDAIDKLAPELAELEGELPHEELNVITAGGNYGWPYCYDNGVPSPEYPNVDCTPYDNPALLLPGHAAPLGMSYYAGEMFPNAYRGNLILGYHGYREYGHRIVIVPMDENGIPAGMPLDIVRDWGEKPSGDPQGAPVGITVASDGSIYVADDKNHSILRIFFDPMGGNGQPMEPLPPMDRPLPEDEQARCDDLATRTDAFSEVQRAVLDLECASCHGSGPGFPGGLALLRCDAIGNAERLLSRRETLDPLVTPGDLNSELLLRLEGRGFPQMPAGGVSPEQLSLVREWILDGAPAPN